MSPIAGFETIARTSSFAMRGNQDVRQIAQKLNVRTVVLGTVEKSAGHVKVTARLIRADDGVQLWAKSYDRDADEIFAIEDEISDAIVDALGMKPVVPLDRAQADESGNLRFVCPQGTSQKPSTRSEICAGLRGVGGSGSAGRVCGESAGGSGESAATGSTAVCGTCGAGRNKGLQRLGLERRERRVRTGAGDRCGGPGGAARDGDDGSRAGGSNQGRDWRDESRGGSGSVESGGGDGLGMLFYLDRQFDAAIAQLKKVDSAETRDLLWNVYADSGKPPGWRKPRRSSPFGKACADARLGDKEGALSERAGL